MTHVRKNDGKANMKYWLMFPHVAKALCERMTENEDKYPNDSFCNYTPEETIASLTRHLQDLSAPYPVHDTKESKFDALMGVAFNALCLAESCIHHEHPFADKGEE